MTFRISRGGELKDASGQLKSTGRSPIGRAVFAISKEIPKKTVRRWLRHALALPRET